ncbi:MAG TPA: FixH family protein [Ktedonobacteraceae bacterium]|jgi:hypothetical protein|nr:FixH family protein [Ktedonobacteraceae bacterium]
MRIRPFFWLWLAFVCASVLTFAALQHSHAPAILQVHVRQAQPHTLTMTTLELHLTDPQGLPIDEAIIHSSARMTNMAMSTNDAHIATIGNGVYRLQLHLSMAGPWEVMVLANAPGFLTQQQVLHLDVV